MRRRNEARLARLRSKQFGPAGFREWTILARRCATCGAVPTGGCQPSHGWRSRGAGADWQWVVPQCPSCHRLLGNRGRETFQELMRCDLEALAREHAAGWEALTPEEQARWARVKLNEL